MSSLINDNGISQVALGFFTALFTLLGLMFNKMIQGFRTVDKAKENAEKAVANTSKVANGFTGRIDNKLDSLIDSVDGIEDSIRQHLEWHLRQEERKRNANSQRP